MMKWWDFFRLIVFCKNFYDSWIEDCDLEYWSLTSKVIRIQVTFKVSSTQLDFMSFSRSFAKFIFFPPNFSFVFWKRKFWREKNYFAKEWIYFAKKIIRLRNCIIQLKWGFTNNQVLSKQNSPICAHNPQFISRKPFKTKGPAS